MSNSFIHDLSKWGIPVEVLKKIRGCRNRTFQAPFGIDSPDTCWLGSDYWKKCQDFEYKFNSWGLRGQDYDQYRKENTDQAVNFCVGDSFTLNVGGPIEHSWPYLLEQRTGIPSINLSSDTLSSYYFQRIIDKNKQLLNVKNIFVLYNVLSDTEAQTLVTPGFSENFDQTLTFLKNHYWVHDAYWQVVPPWVFTEDELPQLYQQLPTAHDYLKDLKINLKDVDINLLLIAYPLRQKYNEIAGRLWISYDVFVKEYLSGSDVLQFFSNALDKHLVKEFTTQWLNKAVRKILFCNRDDRHMNKALNQRLADYFYYQSLTIKPSCITQGF